MEPRKTVNIDAQLVKKAGAKLSQVEERLVEMQNGCICCTLREDLLIEISKLCSEGKYDYLLIESSGISEPMPVAETFTFEVPLPGEETKQLSDIARLDTMVTVIDAYTFNKDLRSIESLAEKWGEEAVPEEDARSVANLLTDQVRWDSQITFIRVPFLSSNMPSPPARPAGPRLLRLRIGYKRAQGSRAGVVGW